MENDRVSLYSLFFLGISLMAGILGTVCLAVQDKPIPNVLAAFIGTAAGGISGLAGPRDRKSH